MKYLFIIYIQADKVHQLHSKNLILLTKATGMLGFNFAILQFFSIKQEKMYNAMFLRLLINLVH